MLSSMAALAIRFTSTCPELRSSGENSSLVIRFPSSLPITYDVCTTHIRGRV
jgi:hypothetical protein